MEGGGWREKGERGGSRWDRGGREKEMLEEKGRKEEEGGGGGRGRWQGWAGKKRWEESPSLIVSGQIVTRSSCSTIRLLSLLPPFSRFLLLTFFPRYPTPLSTLRCTPSPQRPREVWVVGEGSRSYWDMGGEDFLRLGLKEDVLEVISNSTSWPSMRVRNPSLSPLMAE